MAWQASEAGGEGAGSGFGLQQQERDAARQHCQQIYKAPQQRWQQPEQQSQDDQRRHQPLRAELAAQQPSMQQPQGGQAHLQQPWQQLQGLQPPQAWQQQHEPQHLQRAPLQTLQVQQAWQQEQSAQHQQPYVKQMHMQHAQHEAQQSGIDNTDMQPRLQHQGQQWLPAQMPQQLAQQPQQNVLPPPQPSAAQHSKKAPLRLGLHEWQLPASVVEAFADKGVKGLYPWQAAALELGQGGHNLVYCAPTSGGKSIVAELLLIRRLHRMQQQQQTAHKRPRRHNSVPFGRALVVLPYLSIVAEKAEHLARVLAGERWGVRGYHGREQGTPLSHQDEHVAVCSIEKANAAVNRLLLEGRLHELACVVVDEAHMVSDPHRGHILEMLLTKLMAAPTKPKCPKPQIICMSATMSGLEHMSAWLDAALFMTNYRPVPLTEHVVFGGAVFEYKAGSGSASSSNGSGDIGHEGSSAGGVPGSCSAGGECCIGSASNIARISSGAGTSSQIRGGGRSNSGARGSGGSTTAADLAATLAAAPLSHVRDLQESLPTDKDRLLPLVAEVCTLRHSTLIFCPSRLGTQSCAALLAAQLPAVLAAQGAGPTEEEVAARIALAAELREALGGHGNAALETAIESGIGYHHAGLTSEERSIVEAGFRAGTLLVLAATSTLAAGVNLPARRVTLRSLRQGGPGIVGRAQYLQMVGRAGRAGQCDVGESFVLCAGTAGSPRSQWDDVCKLLTAPMPKLASGLLTSTRALAAVGNPAGKDGGVGDAALRGVLQEVLQLQRLLMEAVAVGLASCGPSIEKLLRSTLLFHQRDWEVVAKAGRWALQGLRHRRLTTLKAQPAAAHAAAAAAAVAAGGSATVPSASRSALQQSGCNMPSTSTSSGSSSDRDGTDGGSWELTPLGACVYHSALAPEEGLVLYERLTAVRQNMVLSCSVQLVYLLQQEPAWAVYGWEEWQRLWKQMPADYRAAAMAEGVEMQYIETRINRRGWRGDAATDAKHARMSVAVLLCMLISDASAGQLEEEWGGEKRLTDRGFSRGELQKLQDGLSKQAAMAALLAEKAGWWMLDTMLQALAHQASAGTRPELFALMEIDGMQARYARALNDAGLSRPQLLATATQEELARVLRPCMALRRRKENDKPDFGGGGAGSAARAAERVLVAARRHVVAEAEKRLRRAEQLKDLQGPEDDEEAQPDPGNTAASTATRLLAPNTPPNSALQFGQMQGQATVLRLGASTPLDQLQAALQQWLEQASFSFAVVPAKQQNSTSGAAKEAGWAVNGAGTGSGGSGSGPGSGAAVAPAEAVQELLAVAPPAALALCWSDREVLLLDLAPLLTSAQQAAGSNNLTSSVRNGGSNGSNGHHDNSSGSGSGSSSSAYAALLRAMLLAAFSNPGASAVCCDAPAALSALAALGLPSPLLAVDDVVAAFALWQPLGTGEDGEGDVLRHAQVVLLGGKGLQVPLQPGGDWETRACKEALLGRVLLPTLRALLLSAGRGSGKVSVVAQRQLWSVAYQRVEVPLLAALARARVQGLRVQGSALRALVGTCRRGMALLQQHAEVLMAGEPRCRLASESGVINALVGRGTLAGRPKRGQQFEWVLEGVLRTASKQGREADVQLAQAMLSHHRLAALEAVASQLMGLLPGQPQQQGRQQQWQGQQQQQQQQQVADDYVLLHPAAHIAPQTASLDCGLPAAWQAALAGTLIPALPVVLSRSSIADEAAAVLPLSAPMPVVLALPQPPNSSRSGSNSMHSSGISSTSSSQGIADSFPVGSLLEAGPVEVYPEGGQEFVGRVRCLHAQLPWKLQEHVQRCSSIWRVVLEGTAVAGAGSQQQQGQQGHRHHHQQQQQQQGQQQGSNTRSTLLAARLSLRPCITTSQPGTMFVGCVFEGLPLLTLAWASADTALLQALAQPCALDAAAKVWTERTPLLVPLLSAEVGSGGAALLLWRVLEVLASGHGAGKLAAAVGCERDQAQALVDSIGQAFPAVALLRRRVLVACGKTWFVTTLLGRQLQHRLPPSPPPNGSATALRARTNGERTAFSVYLQGCMADTVRAAAALLQSHVCAPPQPQLAANAVVEPAASAVAGTVGVAAVTAAAAGASGTAANADGMAGDAAPQQAAQQGSQGSMPPGTVQLVYLGREELVMQVQSAHVLPALERTAACLHTELPALLLGRSLSAQPEQQAGLKLWWGGSMCLTSANIYQRRAVL